MASIRKRAWRTASGEARESWIVDFRDQTGTRRHKQFARKKDADRWLLEARQQAERGVFTPDSTSITVGAACQLWLAKCEANGLEPTTLVQYRSHTKHIELLLGSVKLSRLTRPMAEAFVDNLLAEGRSRLLTAKILGSLKALLGEAQRRGLVSQNVAAGVAVSLATRHMAKVAIPTKAEVKALLDAATGRQRALLTLAALAGLRASEIRGLRWCDVDFDRKLIMVRQRADQQGTIGSPKSASSRRNIPMSPGLIAALKEWRIASGARDGLVFPGRDGRPLCHNTLRAMAGRMHRLRHWYASWLISEGFNAKQVQVFMGHSSIAQTYNVYGHLLDTGGEHERLAAAERTLFG
jgi:integrase